MRIGRWLTLSIVVPLALPGVTGAQSAMREAGEEEGVATKGEWTIDDILLAESVGQYRIAPDGAWVVWVKTHVDEDEGGPGSNADLPSDEKAQGPMAGASYRGLRVALEREQ